MFKLKSKEFCWNNLIPQYMALPQSLFCTVVLWLVFVYDMYFKERIQIIIKALVLSIWNWISKKEIHFIQMIWFGLSQLDRENRYITMINTKTRWIGVLMNCNSNVQYEIKSIYHSKNESIWIKIIDYINIFIFSYRKFITKFVSINEVLVWR